MAISDAPQYENALHAQELLLRGLGLRSTLDIAHLTDDFDSIDLTNNRLTHITSEFPRLNRAKMLLLAHNKISAVDPSVGSKLVNVESLSLAYNLVADFETLDFLRHMPKLTHLCLEGNPITKALDYRASVVRIQPHIRFLDFERVTEKERSGTRAHEPATKEGKQRQNELLNKLETAASIEEIDAIEKELAELSGQ